MKIYQNTGINGREEATMGRDFYEEIMEIEKINLIKKGYHGKRTLAIELRKGINVASFGLIGKETCKKFLREIGTSKRKLSKLEGREIISTQVIESFPRIIGIRPIRSNEGFFKPFINENILCKKQSTHYQ